MTLPFVAAAAPGLPAMHGDQAGHARASRKDGAP